MLKVRGAVIGLAILLTVVASGCTGAPAAERAQIQIRTLRTGCCYIEGALAFGRLAGPTGGEFSLEDNVARAAPQDPEALRIIGIRTYELAPGHYTLDVWERVCNGNCDELENPTSQAAAEFDLANGEALLIEVTFPLGGQTRIAVNR